MNVKKKQKIEDYSKLSTTFSCILISRPFVNLSFMDIVFGTGSSNSKNSTSIIRSKLQNISYIAATPIGIFTPPIPLIHFPVDCFIAFPNREFR